MLVYIFVIEKKENHPKETQNNEMHNDFKKEANNLKNTLNASKRHKTTSKRH